MKIHNIDDLQKYIHNVRREGVLMAIRDIQLAITNCHPFNWENALELIESMKIMYIDAWKNIDEFETHKEEQINYRKYIKSPEWKIKADQAKEKAGWRCQLCYSEGNRNTLHAHHRTYERLGNELDTDITVLCSDCHAKFHDKEI